MHWFLHPPKVFTFSYCSIFHFTYRCAYCTVSFAKIANIVAISTIGVTLGSCNCEFSPLKLIGYTNMHCILFWYDCVKAVFLWYIHSIVLQYGSLYTVCTILMQPIKLLKREPFLNNCTLVHFVHLYIWICNIMKPKHVSTVFWWKCCKYITPVFNLCSPRDIHMIAVFIDLGERICFEKREHGFECRV